MATSLLIGIMLILPLVKEVSAGLLFCPCLDIHAEGLTWTEARKVCQDQGRDLVTEFVSEPDWRILKSDILPSRLNKFNNIWHIGLRRDSLGQWTWVNDPSRILNLTSYWQPGQPYPNAKFAAMAMADCPRGKFIGVTDDTIAGFICERRDFCSRDYLCSSRPPLLSTRTPSNKPSQPTAATSTVTSATSDTCECYDIHEEGLTWTEARKVCQSRGGDLAYLSEPHWKILKSDILPNRFNIFNDNWHIGLWRNSSGNWTWVNGSCPLTNLTNYWQPGQPYPNATIAAMAMADCPRGNFKGVENDTIAGFICQGRDYCLSGTVVCSPCAPEHTPSKPSATTSTVTSVLSSSGNIHWTVRVIPLTSMIAVLFSVIVFFV